MRFVNLIFFCCSAVLLLLSGCEALPKVPGNRSESGERVYTVGPSALSISLSIPEDLRSSILVDGSRSYLLGPKLERLEVSVTQSSFQVPPATSYEVSLKDSNTFKRGKYELHLCLLKPSGIEIMQMDFVIKTKVITPFDYIGVHD